MKVNFDQKETQNNEKISVSIINDINKKTFHINTPLYM